MMFKITNQRQAYMVLLLFIMMLLAGYQKLSAQAPDLPEKDSLDQQLFHSVTFSNASETDTIAIPVSLGSSYTLEVTAKVDAATGRGLDIEARDATANGFRLSQDESALSWTAPLSASVALSGTNTDEYYTFRVAVENQQAHIYQNGVYLQTYPLTTIYQIEDGEESDELPGSVYGSNLVENWAGTDSDNAGKPSDYGWAVEETEVDIFNTANGGRGVRYVDVDENSSSPVYFEDEIYSGRVLFIRWDSNDLSEAVYTYPVTLEANTVYNFSMRNAYWSNATGSRTITVGVGTSADVADEIASQVFNTSGTRILQSDNFSFTTGEAGTYYLTFTGDWGLYAISDLVMKEINIVPRFLFGKNYNDGEVDIKIASASYQEGAYAPSEITTGTKKDVLVTGEEVYYPVTFNTNFIVSGKSDVHLTGEYMPLVNSSVQLNSDDAWLFFDNISPSEVIEDWLDNVTIGGVSAVDNTNMRIAIYKNGTAIIPNGSQTGQEALKVYSGAEFSGSTQSYDIDTYHTDLGDFDNNIGSFVLKRGYMATLASNADGSGFSRVYIANDEDLEISELQEGLDSAVSFIRVFEWDWISKKGKAGWSPAQINCTWYYDWNIAGASADDYQYATIRQNAGWPSWEAINSKEEVNHLLGFNEPDRPDQADMTVEEAIEIWPEMMTSGMRIGSPAPSDPFNSWLPTFLERCDELNYRVDFAAIHCYWGGLTPAQWYSQLKQIYDYTQRPLWITEWNNGANWTTESWPTDQDAQFQKQLSDMKGILTVLDTTSFVERYAIYDWVEDKRAMVLADTLTPAGEYYAANKSDFAYSPEKAYVHTWHLVAPIVSSAINEEDYFKVTLTWDDLNGEMGAKYMLERQIEDVDSAFSVIGEFTEYSPGSALTFEDSVYDKAYYRVLAISKNADEAISDTVVIERDADPVAPELEGEVLSSSKIQLTWEEADNARSYNVKRALQESGPFEIILSRTTETAYLDEELISDTTYYYTISALNSAGESENGAILEVKTKELVAPEEVVNPRLATADSRITLSWDFIYDAVYTVLRADEENGTYDTLISSLDTTNYVDSAVVNGQNYYYKIVAYNEAGASPATEVLTGRPIAGQHVYVSFDEPSGTFAEDSWGGFHATLEGDAGHVHGYVYAGALDLTGDNDAHAMLPESVVSTLHDFTIAAWVKFSSISTWMRIFDFGTGTSTYMFLTPQASTSDGMSTIRYGITNGDTEYTLDYADTLALDSWIHFAVTQSEDTISLFVNGVRVATSNDMELSPADLGITTQNYIGKSQWSSDPLLEGAIDEFKIYNYALSEAEIAEASTPAALTAPDAIQDFVAYAADSKVTLNWSPDYDVYYDIFRAEEGQGDFVLLNSGLDAPLYVDSAVTNGDTYYYKIQAYNDEGSSPESDEIAATPVMGRHVFLDFEEDEGTVAKDQWGGYHASLYNNIAWKKGRTSLTHAVALYGSVESYVQLDDGIMSTLENFTISTWVKLNSLSTWMRIFDFGSGTSNYMFLTPQASSSNGMSTLRYGIKNGDTEYSVDYTDTLSLDTWTHFAVAQSGDTVRLYVNGELVATNSDIVISPADLGVTTQNYIGQSQWSSDPFVDFYYDDFKIYNYALSEEELAEDLKSPQEIAVESMSDKYLGDADFKLEAESSAGLNLTYSIADSAVAEVDSAGVVHITGAGSVEIIASQSGNDAFLPAESSQWLTVHPINMEVMYKDGNLIRTDNRVQPYFEIVNHESKGVNLNEITARYWLTMDNYKEAVVDISYSALRNHVKAGYVELAVPRDDAFGYVEYSFDGESVTLDSEKSTGVIQSMISNSNWKQMDESNDFSWMDEASAYGLNEHMTLYRNGQLIFGTEPDLVSHDQAVEVASLSKAGSANQITVYLQLNNIGNVPLSYSDLSLRYWFTSDGEKDLNYWIDYAAVGKSKVDGQFVSVKDELQNADTYFEIKLDSALDMLYPLSSTGEIQFRIAKEDWSAFTENNDYSYSASNNYVLNEHITVYNDGELIYGVGPVAEAATSRMGSAESATEDFYCYPNPVNDLLHVQIKSGAIVTISDISGHVVWQEYVGPQTDHVDLSTLPVGIYLIQIQQDDVYWVRKIIKE